MFTFLPHCFEQLKNELLVTIGLKHIGPSDCKFLSAEIYKMTQKCISETTFKRVFGFAYSRFKPSLFTLDTMAVCCGYNGWEDFCVKNDPKQQVSPVSRDDAWSQIVEQTERITRFTLQILKNRSGIPFDVTIPRKFVNDHLDIFLQDDHTATAFVAPAGYGKTVALCHWVEEQLVSNERESNDVILFFSSATLMANAEGKSLNDWLLALLGIYIYDGMNGLSGFEKHYKGKFYLIIDGLDSHHYKNEQFGMLLAQLSDIISIYQACPWFKVICTMRTATWINNKHIIENGRKQWFPGFMYGYQESINVPLFDLAEFNELSTRTNAPKAEQFTMAQLNKLSSPLFFQYFYNNVLKEQSSPVADPLCIYRVTGSYVCQNTHKGSYASDKLLLIVGLINEIDFDNRIFSIEKVKVHKLIKTYPLAYQDLMSVGLLRETNDSNDVRYRNLIEFTDKDVLENSIARTLLYNNKQLFNADLIECLNYLFDDNALKLSILKWCMYISVMLGTECNFEDLPAIKLKEDEKIDLFIFTSTLIRRHLLTNTGSEDHPAAYWLEKTFNYFFGLELINARYEEALQMALDFKLQPQQRIMVKTCLCIIAAMKLDLAKFESQLNSLSQILEAHFQKLPVNAQCCLDTIYYYLKYGIIKKEAFRELTRFYFNPRSNTAVASSGTNDILYLLALQTLFISQKPNKILRFINVVDAYYTPSSPNYKPLLDIVKAEAYLASGSPDKALMLFYNVTDALDGMPQAANGLTKVLYQALKVKLNMLDNDYALLADDIRYFIQQSDETGLKLLKVNTISYLLAHSQHLKKGTDFINQLYFDFIRTIRVSGCSTDSFLQKNRTEA